jgi:hypothetical protein
METKTLQTQLLEFQKKVNVIKKDSKNPHFKNTYASLTQIISEVKPLLSEVGIVLTQPLINGNVSTFLTYGSEVLESSLPLPVGLQPQPLGSAITYFRRYTLASLLALEIDDDDANEATKKEPVKPFQATATELPALDDKRFLKMLEAIAKGDTMIVKVAMQNYTLLKEQKDELEKQIELKDKK